MRHPKRAVAFASTGDDDDGLTVFGGLPLIPDLWRGGPKRVSLAVGWGDRRRLGFCNGVYPVPHAYSTAGLRSGAQTRRRCGTQAKGRAAGTCEC